MRGGPGYRAMGWRWHRVGDVWHRALDYNSACGAEVRGRGQADPPPVGGEVCETCARLTQFKRRHGPRPTVRVAVELPRDDVRRVRAAGREPHDLLLEAWVGHMAALREAGGLEAVVERDRDLELEVYGAAVDLLPEWAGKGVPAWALSKAAGVSRKELRRVLGTPTPMRFPGRGHHRSYSAVRIQGLRDPL